VNSAVLWGRRMSLAAAGAAAVAIGLAAAAGVAAIDEVIAGAVAAGVVVTCAAAEVARGGGALNGKTHSGTTCSPARALPTARCVDPGGVAVEQAASIAETANATIVARATGARAVGARAIHALMAPPLSIRPGHASTKTA
jgi:hypothetical protein